MRRIFNAFCIITAVTKGAATVQNKITLGHEEATATIECGPNQPWMNFLGKYLSDSVGELTLDNICAVTRDGQQSGETGNILWQKTPVLISEVPADNLDDEEERAQRKALTEGMVHIRAEWMHRMDNLIKKADAAVNYDRIPEEEDSSASMRGPH